MMTYKQKNSVEFYPGCKHLEFVNFISVLFFWWTWIIKQIGDWKKKNKSLHHQEPRKEETIKIRQNISHEKI